MMIHSPHYVLEMNIETQLFIIMLSQSVGRSVSQSLLHCTCIITEVSHFHLGGEHYITYPNRCLVDYPPDMQQ